MSIAGIRAALSWLYRDVADVVATAVIRARLRVLDRILGPFPETPTDRGIREEGERLRNAFPQIDFDDPRRGVPSPPEPRVK